MQTKQGKRSPPDHALWLPESPDTPRYLERLQDWQAPEGRPWNVVWLQRLELGIDGVEVTSQGLSHFKVIRIRHQRSNIKFLGFFTVLIGLRVLEKVPVSVLGEQDVTL